MEIGVHLPQVEFAGEGLSARRIAETVDAARMCAELLSGFAEAGCGRVYLWPLGAERCQIDLIASKVLPGVRL